MRLIIINILLLLYLSEAHAQELNAMVNVNYSQIQGTNREIFQDMQESLYEFVNTTHFTEHVFGIDERIDCQFQITISKRTGDMFEATLSVQSSRPVYGSSYTTAMLNYQEKKGNFLFEYVQDQRLEYSENSFTSNLTAVMAFYAYIIIGMDYDSFGMEAGSPYYQKALNIANNAQSAGQYSKGWQSYEGTENRYWLAENMLNEKYRPIRRCIYRYHRLGLDRMYDNKEAARQEIADSFKLLQRAHRSEPNNFILKLFFTAKSNEIINCFKQAFPAQKAEVVQILKEIDPANASRYDEIMKQ